MASTILWKEALGPPLCSHRGCGNASLPRQVAQAEVLKGPGERQGRK